MKEQTIILLNGTTIARELFKKVIAKTPGLRIIADVEDTLRFPEVANQIDADWTLMILSPGEQVPEAVNQVIEQDSTLHLMTIVADGSRVQMKWMEPHEITLNEKNLKEILQILIENKPNQYEKEKME